MRRFFLVAVCLCSCINLSAAERDVSVFCPAIAFDDHDDRGRSVPHGPGMVVLMAVGKIKKPDPAVTPKLARQPKEVESRSGAVV